MGWPHGQNERRDITEKSWYKQVRRLQKTRKIRAILKMGGLCEERSEKGRGGRQGERKGQQPRPIAFFFFFFFLTKVAVCGLTTRSASPQKKLNQGKNKIVTSHRILNAGRPILGTLGNGETVTDNRIYATLLA